MREYSTPLQVQIPGTGNLTDDVVTNGVEHPAAVVFSRRSGTGMPHSRNRTFEARSAANPAGSNARPCRGSSETGK